MKLEVDCSWDEKRKKAKQIITFEYFPKNIFLMPNETISQLQKFGQTANLEGPPILDRIKAIMVQYPKSVYAAMIYYQTLEFFEYEDKAKSVFESIKKKFPKQVFTKLAIAKQMLKREEFDKFVAFFKKAEILKGVFPQRKLFFFEEVLFFHDLWIQYFGATRNEIQFNKHKNFNLLIINTLKTYALRNG